MLLCLYIIKIDLLINMFSMCKSKGYSGASLNVFFLLVGLILYIFEVMLLGCIF